MTQTTHLIAEAVSEYIVEPDRSQLLNVISAYDTIERANAEFHHLTNIRHFFSDREALEGFRQAITQTVWDRDSRKGREWGDFQTQPRLATQVCHYLAELRISPQIILEPTYGAGNFVLAALKSFPTAQLVYGVEIQEKYEWRLKIALLLEALRGHRSTPEVVLDRDDIFTHQFPQEVLTAQDILIIGNPPWITNAELGVLTSSNLPPKRNLKALNGLDALTGKSNFDLGEFVLLRMLDLFSGRHGTLAMLCKNSVVKNIIEALPQKQFKVSNIRAFEIDAQHEFGAAVEASLLVMDLGAYQPSFACQVATLDEPGHTIRTFGWVNHRFVSSIKDYKSSSELDGESPFVWRQGIKHDCATVMELEFHDGILTNGNKEVVVVEDEWIYWLLKSSDLKDFEIYRARKKILVTQRQIGEDTSNLQKTAPKLWGYLTRNSHYFERRKSSIYRDKPRFSIFGIGEYSFKPYKVAIAGLYKEPRFSIVGPIDNRPVMLDDTCYLLGFDTYLDALFTASLLNSSVVKRFLQSIVFTDAKRPYTKEVLMRINLMQAASQLSLDALNSFWDGIGYSPRVPVTAVSFEEYKRRCLNTSGRPEIPQLGLGI